MSIVRNYKTDLVLHKERQKDPRVIYAVVNFDDELFGLYSTLKLANEQAKNLADEYFKGWKHPIVYREIDGMPWYVNYTWSGGDIGFGVSKHILDGE